MQAVSAQGSMQHALRLDAPLEHITSRQEMFANSNFHHLRDTIALAFPGAFSHSGLFGSGLQSAVWLYWFWHQDCRSSS
jgi:hypothetical protein